MLSISPGFFPRSMFDTNTWFGPDLGLSALDVFDPFDEIDRMLSRNLFWLTTPEYFHEIQPLNPKIPHKYRVRLDVSGYKPDSIKTDIKDNKLYVTGQEGKKTETEDYSLREFRKSYDLPPNVEADKLVSFVTPDNQLVIEIPLKEEKVEAQEKSKFPEISLDEKENKRVTVNIVLPENLDQSQLSVACKDNDLIIKSKYKKQMETEADINYFRRITLPDNTDFNTLNCVCEENKLVITAPLLETSKQKTVPIKFGKSQEQAKMQTEPSQKQENIAQQSAQQKEA